VLACNYNSLVMLGMYPEKNLHDIWFSSTGHTLKKHMEHNDLSYGCEYCANFINNSKFSGLKPQVFDKYSDYKKNQYPKVMEFEMLNTCNLECIMCNGMASSSIRKNRENFKQMISPYDDTFVQQLEEFIPHLQEAKFYGGEPFLIDIYHMIWEKIFEINPKINIFVITNGTIMNEKIKDYLEKGNFDLAVSIDSVNKEKYEHIRKNANFENVMKNVEYLSAYSLSRNKVLSISITLMRINWDDVPDMVRFANHLKAITYFSYLSKPENLSLSNLASKELFEIRRKLSINDFPEDTEFQKYNKYCFRDFLYQLEVWENRNNMTRPFIEDEKDCDINFAEDLYKSLEEIFMINFSKSLYNRYVNYSPKEYKQKKVKLTKKLYSIINHKSVIINKEDFFGILLKFKMVEIIEHLENKSIKTLIKQMNENIESLKQ